MATFDSKTFFELTGKGGGPVGALGTAFGMPSCMVNLTTDVLTLLPSPVLNGIRGSAANGSARANDVTKALFGKLRYLTGGIEYDTEDGIFRFVSDSSKNGLDSDEGGFLGALGGVLGAAGAAAGFAGQLYNNYQNTQAQIDSISDCLGSFKDYLDYSGGNAGAKKEELSRLNPEAYSAMLNSQFGIELQDAKDAQTFADKADSLLANVDAIITARLQDPSLEPEFRDDYASILSGTNSNLGQPEETLSEEVFRLNFGPPVSKNGRFVLSIDGLYYDSQTSGIIPALMDIEQRRLELPSESNWKLEYDPNLGGRGVPTSTESLRQYFDTILDPNVVDDSDFLTNYYTQDNLLLDLIGNKNRKIYDVSAYIGALEASGSSQILIANMRQVMLSETSHFIDKINKRKKQIELAVKLPALYRNEFYFQPGEIPINDFSYLEGINFLVDVEKQRSIVLNQSDVSGVVLPLEVKFTQQLDVTDPIVFEHLLINNIASGTIISTDPNAVSAPSLSVNQTVIGDELFAMYNYLTAQVDRPESVEFQLHNRNSNGIEYNAQLVASTASSVFDRGLGIAYLDGVMKLSSEDLTYSSTGNFIRLPPKPEFQDFLYSSEGATFETWVHVPELDGVNYGFGENGVSGLYRLILSNENTGFGTTVSSQSDINYMRADEGSNVVRGLILGFTRDRRFTTGELPSNLTEDNPVTNAVLVLAPTQSFDSSSVGFINKSFALGGNCDETLGWHGMTAPIWGTQEGVSLSSCGREFCQITVSLDPVKDEVRMYLDGVKLSVSSYTTVFGKSAREGMPRIPSIKKENSLSYPGVGLTLDTYFSPWILGGGWTDGNPNGNFMGGTYGGTISGLKGYLGNTKFYSRALTTSQIKHNFEATRTFFKNIEVPNLMWEPIDIQ